METQTPTKAENAYKHKNPPLERASVTRIPDRIAYQKRSRLLARNSLRKNKEFRPSLIRPTPDEPSPLLPSLPTPLLHFNSPRLPNADGTSSRLASVKRADATLLCRRGKGVDVDGDVKEQLPVRFTVKAKALRVIA